MTDATAYLAAAVFLGFAAYRAAARGDATQRCISTFALCMGTAMVINAPASVRHLARLPHERPLIVVLVHGLKLGAFTCLALIALTLRQRTDDRGPVHRHLAAGVAVQAVSAVLFAASSVAVTSHAVAVGRGHRPVFAGYEVLFAVYGMVCLLMLVRALAGHIRAEPNAVVRVGLGLMALSASCGILWTAWSAHDIARVLLTGRQGLGEDLPSTCFGVAVAVFGACGASATRWPVLVGRPLRWLWARRAYRALEPLWSALHAEVPEIALAPHTAGRRARPREATYALYRRVIEIRDAHLALRPYFDPVAHGEAGGEAHGEARGRSHGEGAPTGAPARATAGEAATAGAGGAEAAREAAAIARALANRRAGRRPGGDAAEGDAAGRGPAGIQPVPGTLDAETDWLLQVTHAFVRRGVRGARGAAAEEVR